MCALPAFSRTFSASLLMEITRKPSWLRAKLPSGPGYAATRRLVGATPQVAGFPDNRTVAEVVDLVRGHNPDPAPTQDLLGRFGLAELAGRRAGGLSGGQTRRLAVALAFAGRPRLVVLDEPTTGLDVEARRGLWALLRDFVAGGGAVLLTTHYLEEAQALASRVVVIADGQVVAHGSVDDITARAGLRRGYVRAPSPPGLEEAILRLTGGSS